MTDTRETPATGREWIRRLSSTLPWALSLLLFALAGAAPARASSCTPQAEMPPADRDALIAAATPMADAVATGNLDLLQASLLPAVVADWESIRGGAQAAGPLLKGGQLHWRNAYFLVATDLKGPTDTQFFCTTPDSSLTVTINLRSLPPGQYGLLLGDFAGSPQGGQIALVLGFDSKWKLGGLFVREGDLSGHDGVWYWTQARELAKTSQPWSAWFTYDTARLLLVPVDFISSPNLEKLNKEQTQLKANPQDALPLSVPGVGAENTGKKWKVTALHVDTTLHAPDLGLTYEGTGQTDPRAQRAEAVAVMSGFLKLHPEIRDSFHGLWAYSETDGKQSYAIEQAMHDIP
jgi:hypothetical protein